MNRRVTYENRQEAIVFEVECPVVILNVSAALTKRVLRFLEGYTLCLKTFVAIWI
jgi:hypothetical protein